MPLAACNHPCNGYPVLDLGPDWRRYDYPWSEGGDNTYFQRVDGQRARNKVEAADIDKRIPLR